MTVRRFKAVPAVTITGSERPVEIEELDSILPAEPVDYAYEGAVEIGIAEGIRRLQRNAVLARIGVLGAAAFLAFFGFARPATLEALGVVPR